MDVQIKQKIEDLKAEYLTISYKGPFDGRVLGVFAKELEDRAGESSPVAKKIFKIFIELAQNIALYSAEKVKVDDSFSGYGIFILKEYSDYFWLLTGNKAKRDDAFLAGEKCKTINELSREQLREYKRTLRKQPPNDKGGGNIGLIQVALLANDKINYQINHIDEKFSFFTIGIKISKN